MLLFKTLDNIFMKGFKNATNKRKKESVFKI